MTQEVSHNGIDHGVGYPMWLSVRGKSTCAPEKRGVRGLRHHAECPQVANTVIEAQCGSARAPLMRWGCSRRACRASWPSSACRAGAESGCARSASWSSPWTPMPRGSSSDASSPARRRCGGSRWRYCRQPPMVGTKTSTRRGSPGPSWSTRGAHPQRSQECGVLSLRTSTRPGRSASRSCSRMVTSCLRTLHVWRGRDSRRACSHQASHALTARLPEALDGLPSHHRTDFVVR